MSLFITEAFVVGLKEAMKLWLAFAVFSAIVKNTDKKKLLLALYSGLAVTIPLGVFSYFAPSDPYIKETIVRMEGYIFFIFLSSSLIAFAWDDFFKNIKTPSNWFIWLTVFLGTFIYVSPDVMGTSMFLRDTAVMKSNYEGAYLSFFIGFAVLFSLGFIGLVRKRIERIVPGVFGIPQYLLFLSLIKLAGGGIKGLAELSLIPSVQRGMMKFFHDVVHQLFVFLMVPDHPMLKLTVWNFVGILFGSTIAMTATLLILIMPPLIVLYRILYAPIPATEEGMKAAEKRMQRSEIRTQRRKKAFPIVLFVIVVFSLWYVGRSEKLTRLYNPMPLPLIEDKGTVMIPLTDPTMNLFDGKMHKFSFVSGGHAIRLIVIKKPDDSLAVCLDACEICPPDGYGQAEGKVICIYCITPIPIATLGKPGGCNPIPVSASISEKDIRISVDELVIRWKEVKSKENKE